MSWVSTRKKWIARITLLELQANDARQKKRNHKPEEKEQADTCPPVARISDSQTSEI